MITKFEFTSEKEVFIRRSKELQAEYPEDGFDLFADRILKFDGFESPTGVYEAGLNDNHILDGLLPFGIKYYKHEYLSEDESYFAVYGVADSLEQIAEYIKPIQDKNIFVLATPIRKEEQPEWGGEKPEWGGWRWHKWGQYIGKQSPQCEYLYDEPIIELVYVFRIYEAEYKRVFE